MSDDDILHTSALPQAGERMKMIPQYYCKRHDIYHNAYCKKCKSQYQIITLQLSNGRKVKSVSPVFCNEDEIGTLFITEFKITPPINLPKGCEWQSLSNESDSPKRLSDDVLRAAGKTPWSPPGLRHPPEDM
jgi:hypothetical protein